MEEQTFGKQPFIPEDLDKAASEARQELDTLELDEATMDKLGEWWRKWYMKAGHKRLARKLLQYTKPISLS